MALASVQLLFNLQYPTFWITFPSTPQPSPESHLLLLFLDKAEVHLTGLEHAT